MSEQEGRVRMSEIESLPWRIRCSIPERQITTGIIGGPALPFPANLTVNIGME